MIKKYSLVLVVFLCFVVSGFGQVTIYNENMYNGTGGASGNSIAAHETNNRFNEDGLTYSGSGDMRTTNSSIGLYPGASGTFNVLLNAINEDLIMDGLNMTSYSSITLSFGIRKSTNAEDGSNFIVEYSTSGASGSYTAVTIPSLPTGSGTATYHYRTSSSAIPSTTTTIRFRSTNAIQWNIDDILLEGIACTDAVDLANIQFPNTSPQNINDGDNLTVYARAYEPGVTEAAGQGAGLNAWIGYSTTNNDPSTASWAWLPASFNVQVGNDDEFLAEIGSGLAPGTYYYASRFQLNDCGYVYGGTGGIWSSDSVQLIVNPVQVDFCNVEFPKDETIVMGNPHTVYAQVYEPGVTDAAGQGGGIDVEIGYNTIGINHEPWNPSGWTWITASYNPSCLDCNGIQNDEYMAEIGSTLPTGTYYYASRFQLNGSSYSYGGIQSDNVGNFWDATNNNGVLTITAPEIDIERNTFASIPTTSNASTGFNTVFASETIGNTSSGKTFYIHNEGTANLTVTSLVSANAAEFPVTFIPAVTFPLTISPGTRVEFEIAFSPNSILPSSTRVSTITVRSNDANEDPYTFNVRGTANCAASALTINPISGPVGTVVTVQGTNFGAVTTANINGTAVTEINVLSSNLIEVTVPAGATTGSLEVTNQIGCKSSSFFSLINNQITSCQGSGTLPSALFISEVTDHGSGSHSYVEIYNGTGSAINLTGYQLRIHNNGTGTATNTINLNGTVANNDVFVVAFGSTEASNPYSSHGFDQVSTISGINEDDNIRLYNGSTWVDLWGETTGNAFTIASKDYVYRRKNTGIIVPSTTWNLNDWVAFTPVDYSNIGSYDFSVGSPPSVTVHPTAPIINCATTASLSVTATEGFVDGNPLAYQWYYNVPGTATWIIILSSNPDYTGQQSETLNILNTLNSDQYQYYCQVRENTSTCYAASNAIRIVLDAKRWNGSVSNNWNTAANWTPSGEPTIANMVVIPSGTPNDLVLAGAPPVPPPTSPPVYAKSLVVLAGASIELQIGQNLIVENCIINNGTIDLKNTANLVQINEDDLNSGNGDFFMERIVNNVGNLNYIYWSSPIAGFNISVIPGSTTHRYYWSPTSTNANGTDGNWINAGGTMNRGVGYIIRTSNANANLNVSMGGSGLGTPHNGTFTTPISKGATTYPISAENVNNYWNLVGNPYPSALSADKFITVNAAQIRDDANPSLLGTIYLWQHQATPNPTFDNPFYQNFAINYDGNNYVAYNYTGSNPSGIFNGSIASGQAFFVLMDPTTSPTSVTFTNEMRYGEDFTDAYNNGNFLRQGSSQQQTESSSNIERNRIWLDLIAPNNSAVSTLIGYVTGATNDKDRLFDGYETNSTGLGFYSIVDNEHMGIQGRALPFDAEDTVALGVNLLQTGTFTIAINQLDGLFEDSQSIFLEDTYTNTIHNMRAAPYTFQSGSGRFNDRFILRYTNSTLSLPDINLVTGLTIIELTNGQVKFVVENNLDILSVEIIDMLGRTLYNLKGNSPSEVYELSNLSQAPYMAKVTLSNGQVITKRAVKRF